MRLGGFKKTECACCPTANGWAGRMVVTRMDTQKYGETLKFMYIKYQPILVVLPKLYITSNSSH